MAQDQNHLVWLDMEMTGLQPESDAIIEIAMVITDSQLNTVAEGPVIAIHQSDSVLDGMDEWNKKTHGRSGLLERVRASTVDVVQAQHIYLEFLKQWVPERTSPMCGNSICRDRRFMARWMPVLEAWFHYRNLDVSTLKELARRWAPDVVKALTKHGKHEALADIYESIEELKHYRTHFIKLKVIRAAMQSFEQALALLLQQAAQAAQAIERVCLTAALGRVLAHDVYAPMNVPPQANSAMDGYAVRVEDVSHSATELPISQRIAAGECPSPLQPNTCARIFTGALIPCGANAVVMQEDCQLHASAAVSLQKKPQLGDFIRQIGEDIQVGALVLPKGHKLQAQDLGLLASLGLAKLDVFQALRVAIFMTGNELRAPGEMREAGQIYDANSFMLKALLTQLGCVVTDLGRVQDDYAQTRNVLNQAQANCDLIISCGGVSVGEEDHVKAALQAEGELHLWKIAIKPGKPLAYGRLGLCHFIGLPGNPVSCFVTFMMLIVPFIKCLQGITDMPLYMRKMRADFNVLKRESRHEFLRVKCNQNNGLDLFANQASHVLTSCVWADGFVSRAPHQLIQVGDWVDYFSLQSILA